MPANLVSTQLSRSWSQPEAQENREKMHFVIAISE